MVPGQEVFRLSQGFQFTFLARFGNSQKIPLQYGFNPVFDLRYGKVARNHGNFQIIPLFAQVLQHGLIPLCSKS